MNAIDDYDIHIRDNCRMKLYLVEKALKMNIPIKAVQKDTKDVLDPLYNHEKIYDRPIVNVKIDRDENVDINNRARHII